VAALLLFGLRRNDESLLGPADWGVIAVAAGSTVAWASGPAASQQIEAWTDPAATAFAERHANLGEFVIIVWAIAALAALWGIFLRRAGRPSPRWRTPVLLVLICMGIAMAAWAGHEGGRIRHEELRHGVEAPATQEGNAEPSVEGTTEGAR